MGPGRALARLRPDGTILAAQPEVDGDDAADQQEGRQGSTLELYRALLATRRDLALGRARLVPIEAYAARDDVVAWRSVGADRGDVAVVVNLGLHPLTLPAGAQVVVASGPPRRL